MVALAVLGTLSMATPAQALTAWILRPAEQAQTPMYVGLTRTAPPRAVLVVPNAADTLRYQWTLQRVAGSVQYPRYLIRNRALPGCLWGNNGVLTLSESNCVGGGTYPRWWAFTSIDGRYVQNPGLSSYSPREYQISNVGAKSCFTVPSAQFVPNVELFGQACPPTGVVGATHQRMRLYRLNLP